MASIPQSSASLALDAEGRVAIDLPCLGCGYNLRTLFHDAVCPECAKPVEDSLRGGFLRFADPDWVKGLGRGLLLVLITPIAGIVLQILVTMILASGSPSGDAVIEVFIVQFLAILSVTVLGILGLYWLTRRDPAADPQYEGWSARRLTRWSSWLLTVGPLYWLVLVVSAFSNRWLEPSGPQASAGFGTFMLFCMFGAIAVMAVYCVTPIVLMRHMMVLLRRIPRPGLALFAHIEFWGLVVALPLLVIGYLVSMLAFTPMVTSVIAAVPTSMPTTQATSMPAGGSTVSMNYSYTTSSGVTVSQTITTMPTSITTSSMPASMPAFAGPGPAASAMIMFGSAVTMLGGCSTVVLSIAGLVLLIMSCVAFNSAARDAATCMAESANIASLPDMPPPSET